MIPIVLSGGSGTRLWPVSRQQLPKQFCSILGKPLQTQTLERSFKLGRPLIVTSEELRTMTMVNLNENNMESVEVLFEPSSRNTAPAVAIVVQHLINQGKAQEVAGVFPSDHLIKDEKAFAAVAALAEKQAMAGKVVTLGITPSYPETGYGYIQSLPETLETAGNLKAHPVKQFHEKPDLKTAQEFLASGNFSWNAGIFVFKVERMAELFANYQPEIWNKVKNLKADLSNLKELYQELPTISIDYAIMEKLSAEELACIPAEFGWSDVGSWDAVADIRSSDDFASVESQNVSVMGVDAKAYSFVGMSDVIVVDTADALLVMKKGESQKVKDIVESFKKERPAITKEHRFEYRPWGYFEILKDTETFKSKVIRVNPGAQLSYQSHERREEHWTITRGTGEVVLNDQIIPVKAGTYVHIPLQAKHRMRNTGTEELEFIEVQLGTYFGEDDIKRYEDDYKRN